MVILFFILLADVIANVMWQMFSPLQYIATIDWLILLPCGRWNSHYLFLFVMADVIALWQMEWPLQGVSASSW